MFTNICPSQNTKNTLNINQDHQILQFPLAMGRSMDFHRPWISHGFPLVQDIFRKPVQGARQDGAKGLAVGCGTGIAGGGYRKAILVKKSMWKWREWVVISLVTC